MLRRSLLSGIAVAALGRIARARAQSALAPPATPALGPQPASGPQAPKLDDTVAAGYNRIVIARWGDGVLPNAPAFNPNPLTAEQASTQFPYDAVLAGLVAPPPAQDGIPRLIAVFANPDAPARMVFPGGADNPAVAGKLQGATIVNLQYLGGRWVTVDGGYQSRRLTDGTLCQISGPAASAIGSTVQGLLAPQGGCATPWGTALLAEGDAANWLTRLANTGLGYNDPTVAPRFSWITEIDPLDPLSFPTKRTALGRFARSAVAAAQTTDGRPVIFMSQDAHSGFLFRFIAATNATDGTALDSGTLAVAQVQDSNINWINLGADVPTLVGTLGAARAAGGSPFDSPGGIAISSDGSNTIYLATRGNPTRSIDQTDALNPRAGDDNGYILVFSPPNGDLTAASFAGNIAISAGNPATAPFTQYTPGSNAWFKNPRTLNLDATGQLWIGTDQRGKISDTADGLFVMQTGGASKFLVDTAYLAPVGAAIGGAAFDVTSKTTFGMVRHPGATPASSFDQPATRWPTLLPTMPPQSTVIGLVS
jgi:secreted PhoX family phosphatase